jgi:hypothetical protein
VAGVIFTYMGPGEPPLLPAYKTLTAREEYRFSPTKCFHECSYLQANEGNLDPVHLSFLHRLQEASGSPGTSRINPLAMLTARDVRPAIEAEQTDFGLRIYALRKAGEGQTYVRITNFIMPNLCAIAGGTGGDGYQVDWHVPIDDTHHWKYTMAFRASAPLGDKARARQDLTAGYRLTRNAINRYLQDREEMKAGSFSGLGTNFLAHDAFAVESQGPIQDRGREHLGSTDKGIVMARLMLLRAIRDVEAGRDPRHVIRDPIANRFPDLVVKSEVIPSSKDWKSYWREAL